MLTRFPLSISLTDAKPSELFHVISFAIRGGKFTQAIEDELEVYFTKANGLCCMMPTTCVA